MRITLSRKLFNLVASVALVGAVMVMPLGASASHPASCFEAITDLAGPDREGHVQLCHFTGNPGHFVFNQPSLSAWESGGHQNHHGDCWKFFGTAAGAPPDGCGPA